MNPETAERRHRLVALTFRERQHVPAQSTAQTTTERMEVLGKALAHVARLTYVAQLMTSPQKWPSTDNVWSGIEAQAYQRVVA